MFGYVIGTLLNRLELDSRFVLVTVMPQDVSGFGISMLVVADALERQIKLNQGNLIHKRSRGNRVESSNHINVSFYIYNYVTQHDSYALGISDLKRFRLFLNLLRYSGVGPKIAALIVEFYEDFDTLLHILVHKDVAKLAQVPGIGRKKASKILLNLIDAAETQQFIGRVSQDQQNRAISERFRALIGALQALGLSKTEALRMVNENLNEINAFLDQVYSNNIDNGGQDISKYTGELLKLVLKSRKG